MSIRAVGSIFDSVPATQYYLGARIRPWCIAVGAVPRSLSHGPMVCFQACLRVPFQSEMREMQRLLDTIDDPRDLHGLTTPQLEQLAREIREELIESITRTGGHLASDLGTVELTVALHSVFDSPQDKLVWDTGHQA